VLYRFKYSADRCFFKVTGKMTGDRQFLTTRAAVGWNRHKKVLGVLSSSIDFLSLLMSIISNRNKRLQRVT
jgi:hypothetical protein